MELDFRVIAVEAVSFKLGSLSAVRRRFRSGDRCIADDTVLELDFPVIAVEFVTSAS